ncbi:hypothetical protein Cl131_gp134 [Aphanizomenon phage vB_AphaS-CL131]|nr:hypothetical protein Cl131_gp134 [Aphanizomenon phage vB_AphaS-CL131]
MKIGALRDGSGYYAAQYNQQSEKVEIVDTDTDLSTLLDRHGFLSDEDDSTEEITSDVFSESNDD